MKSTFKTLTTITGREIRVRENKSKRTFTIVTSAGKYRTYQMSKEEFENCMYKTDNDWINFLQKGNFYYSVK